MPPRSRRCGGGRETVAFCRRASQDEIQGQDRAHRRGSHQVSARAVAVHLRRGCQTAREVRSPAGELEYGHNFGIRLLDRWWRTCEVCDATQVLARDGDWAVAGKGKTMALAEPFSGDELHSAVQEFEFSESPPARLSAALRRRAARAQETAESAPGFLGWPKARDYRECRRTGGHVGPFHDVPSARRGLAYTLTYCLTCGRYGPVP